MNKERINTRKVINNFQNKKKNQKAIIVQLSLNKNGCIYPSNLAI